MSKRTADLSKVLGSRQASIMEFLWANGSQSVSALHQGLSDRDGVAYTTVFTELSRMLKKGLVAKSNEGGSHLDTRYRAAVTRESVVSSVVTATIGGLIAAHGPAAVHGFVDAVANDAEALAELRRLLENRAGKRR